MSDEGNFNEAKRWLSTAEQDLETARILRSAGKYPYCCFHAQQAAEKALKAVYYAMDGDPWGHSIVKLVLDLSTLDPVAASSFNDLMRDARLLDRFYIQTRYPDGLPDITPMEAFDDSDAEEAEGYAERFVDTARRFVK